MVAFIYARFSTLEQSRGTSLERQIKDCQAFCDRQGWDHNPDRHLIDEGLSAYHGTNRAEGSELARFIEMAASGQLPTGTVLVVERLDRLSRQSPLTVVTFMDELTRNGVTVATVDGDTTYDKASFDFSKLLLLITKAQLAHEESEKKSQRLGRAWSIKRSKALDGSKEVMTAKCPAWISVQSTSGNAREYVLLEDRSVVVQRIFDLATTGHGKHLIARTLNQEGVPAWGRSKSGWHPSYIQKIIRSRTVLGELQPHRKIGGKRLPEGDPIKGIYPAVIDELTFARAQSDRASRTGMPGRRTLRFNNLVSGVAKCGSCGSSMTFVNKGGGDRYLVCDKALRMAGCAPKVAFPYQAVERVLIDYLLIFALDDRHFEASEEVTKLERGRAEAIRSRDELIDQQRRLVDLLARHENEVIVERLAELSLQASSLKESIADKDRAILLARGRLSPRQNVERLRSFVGDLASDDQRKRATARGAMQQALRSLIDRMLCDPNEQTTHIEAGRASVTCDRHGTVLNTAGISTTPLEKLLDLRDRGWIVSRHRDHPALGRQRK